MPQERSHKAVQFGPFVMDLESGELRRDGRLVSLRPMATRALLLFVRNPGRLVSREELRRELWGGTAVDWGNGIHQAIRQVRRALGEHGHSYLETVPRRGYRFTANVSEVATLSGSAILGSRGAFYAAGVATPVVGIVLILVFCDMLAA